MGTTGDDSLRRADDAGVRDLRLAARYPVPAMFLSGVIEGFYGPPWSQAERAALFAQMAAWGLDTYLYCPKDDLHHRAVWREPYGETDGATMAALIRRKCRRGTGLFSTDFPYTNAQCRRGNLRWK